MTMMFAKLAMPPVKTKITPLGSASAGASGLLPGGLDQQTPTLSLHAGALRDGLNYECSQNGGYGRIAGYERFDGKTAPSSASFDIVQVDGFTVVPAIGDSITQAGSGAMATVAAIVNGPDAYYMVVTQLAGTFNDTDAISLIVEPYIVDASNEPVIVDALNEPLSVPYHDPLGVAVAQTVSIDAQLQAQYTAAAADIYRSLIGEVPGSGAILGVFGAVLGGAETVYAFRASADGTTVNLYKSSVAGWVNVPFFHSVSFTAGNVAIPSDGDTLTQGGVTATIMRVVWQSGSFTDGSAIGDLVITDIAGGNFSAGAATISGGTTLTLSGAQTAITLLPGGRFENVKANFYGQANTRRVYLVDGVNKAMEFDGQTLVPISTGLVDDAPSHIAFHRNYLFLSYQSSIIHSAPGEPFKFLPIDNGGEIATGNEITAMISLPGSVTASTLAIFSLNNTSMLYGLDPTDFNFQPFNTGSGALEFTAQNIFDTFFFDIEAGVLTLQTTLNFGNFQSSALTKNMVPFILQERTKAVASIVNRAKSQYRVFFNDGYALYATVVNKAYLGAIPVRFPNPVSCCDNAETADGTEKSYFGSSDGGGYVYRLDVGPSFDGENIDAYITLAWDAFKTPRDRKLYRGASIEIASSGYTQIAFGYKLGYNTSRISQPGLVNYDTNFASAPQWDDFTWDNFTWDGLTLEPTEIPMTGTAENVQVTLSSTTNYIEAFNLNSIIYHYSPRRGMRI